MLGREAFLPTTENHVRLCVKEFGEKNRELCCMVNSWMDAPSRDIGKLHRRKRHDPVFTPIEACRIYGDYVDKGEVRGVKVYRILETEKNKLIVLMVLQHLKLDGLIIPEEVENWTWEKLWKNVETYTKKEIDVPLGWYYFINTFERERGIEERVLEVKKQKDREEKLEEVRELKKEKRELKEELKELRKLIEGLRMEGQQPEIYDEAGKQKQLEEGLEEGLEREWEGRELEELRQKDEPELEQEIGELEKEVEKLQQEVERLRGEKQQLIGQLLERRKESERQQQETIKVEVKPVGELRLPEKHEPGLEQEKLRQQQIRQQKLRKIAEFSNKIDIISSVLLIITLISAFLIGPMLAAPFMHDAFGLVVSIFAVIPILLVGICLYMVLERWKQNRIRQELQKRD